MVIVFLRLLSSGIRFLSEVYLISMMKSILKRHIRKKTSNEET